MQALQHTIPAGPTLIHLLARFTAVDVPKASQSLADSLSQWLDWTNAISLSTALSSDPPPALSNTQSPDVAEKECMRVRASLKNSIVGDSALAPGKRARPSQNAASEDLVDYAAYRHLYVSKQQSMETAIANLRGRVRDMLSARASGMVRLAMVDASMEVALAHRERALLSGIPTVLATHFNHLQPREQPASPTWLETFRKDMQMLLLAELDLRFQPVDGLLAALRAS